MWDGGEQSCTPRLSSHILSLLPEPSALLPPLDPMATAGLEPKQGEQHPGYATTLRILANMPSHTIGECHPLPVPPLCPSYPGCAML